MSREPRCYVCNGLADSGVHRSHEVCPGKLNGKCDGSIHHPFDETLAHRPMRHIVECTCGWSGSPLRFEQHRREREPVDTGRWIAAQAPEP